MIEKLQPEIQIHGKVVAGAKRGKQLGFPTANLQIINLQNVPAEAIYCGFAIFENKKYMAAIHIGKAKTFNETKDTIEAYILDFDQNIYDKDLTLIIIARLREMIKFDSIPELINQIQKDVEITKEFLNPNFNKLSPKN